MTNLCTTWILDTESLKRADRLISELIVTSINSGIWTALLAVLTGLTACRTYSDGMLNPKGFVAFEERKLFFDTLALMLIVVIPVIIMSLTFVYHYRASLGKPGGTVVGGIVQ